MPLTLTLSVARVVIVSRRVWCRVNGAWTMTGVWSLLGFVCIHLGSRGDRWLRVGCVGTCGVIGIVRVSCHTRVSLSSFCRSHGNV